MKQVTITIPDELEEAIGRYSKGFEDPPELDTLMRRALEYYLAQHTRQQPCLDDMVDDSDDIIYPTGPKIEPLADAPMLLDGSSVADAVIEDRR
jgi:hypothetical protein